MPNKIPIITSPARDRGYLIGVEIRDQPNLLTLDDSLSELSLLAETAGLEVVGSLTQKLDRPHPDTYIGSGKVEELKALAEESMANIIIFDSELSPRHQRELERALGNDIQVIDRTALILDIFAQHAHTSEGQLQVKMAQYEYYLPRLTKQWTHLIRQAGGGGGRTGSVGGVGLRGPGEMQLEVDRRAIRREIAYLKRELDKVRSHRMRYRSLRKRNHIPTVALVGYTNAGKSTLLNRLTNANVYVADQLFATLDPTTRRVELSDGHLVLFTDTVGMIQKLPTTLIAAFRATLEEITDSDLLLHIVDISHPNAMNQAEAVCQILEEINAEHLPVITALNKIDRLPNPKIAKSSIQNYPHSVAISAITGEGLPNLLSLVSRLLFEAQTPILIHLPYQQGRLISLFHQYGKIDSIEHQRGGVRIKGSIPERLIAIFKPWEVNLNRCK